MLRFSDEAELPPPPPRFYDHFIPDDPATQNPRADDPEVLEDVGPVEHLPTTPFAFMRFLVGKHFLGRTLLMVLTIMAAVIAEALAPYALSQAVDALALSVTSADGSPGDDALSWFAIMVGLWIVSELIYRLYDVQDVYVGPRMRAAAQKYLFRYLLGHSPRYFQDNFAGRLAQKVKNAGQAVITVIDLMVRDLTAILVVMVVGIALLALHSWVFAAILVGWSIVYVTVIAVLARECALLSHDLSQRKSSLTGKLVDTISNADAVRAFAQTDHERRYVSRYIFKEMTGSMRLRWFLAVMRLFQGIAMWVLRLGLLGFAVWEVLRGSMTVGAFTMVFVLANMTAANLRTLSYQILNFFEFYGSLSEALEVISEPHEITDAKDASSLVVRDGGIRFENVAFTHQNGTPVFRSLTLDIAPGEKVGLVGRSGAGKSTLIKLLRRQFEPQAGRILIDDQDVRDVEWHSLNEAIAEVPQVPSIFHRTVRDNIRYADPLAGDPLVKAAAHKAHAHDFIMDRETGYETVVGEQGIKLSGGERQRVAIARAFIKNARILVLDEATSALDSESEHHIQNALFELMKGRTVIAIAHRLSTLKGMDRIVVLDQGDIVQTGTHEQLLSRGGIYADLWNRQAGGFVTDAA